MKTQTFLHLDCIELTNDTLTLLITQSVGPRVLSLRYRGGENLFAELPDLTTETPVGTYHFYGGHRLWRAPEDLSLTYLPDDAPVEMAEIKKGVKIIQPTDSAGVQKTITLTLEGASVTLEHTLTNHCPTPIVCAPWAITQLKPGGVGILPQSTEATGLLPNRQIALWPYTDICSPHIVWGNRYTLVQATMLGGALKIGFPNPRGWLAYWRNGILFVKKTVFDPQATYLDNGSSSECYCNAQFLELETLGGVTTLHEGETVSHIETWEVYGNVEKPGDEEEVDELIKKYGLISSV
ncbi:MAG: hypothetical protein Fur0022_11670 [Anaerolineales bacterium]